MSATKRTHKTTNETSAASILQQQGWIDNQDIMQHLHVSARTLQKWRSSSLLPFYRVRGKIYYKSAELAEMIESCRCTVAGQKLLSSIVALVYMLLSNFELELVAAP